MKLKNIFTSCSSGSRSQRLYERHQQRTTLDPNEPIWEQQRDETDAGLLSSSISHDKNNGNSVTHAEFVGPSSATERPLSFYENSPVSNLPPAPSLPENKKGVRHWFQSKAKNKRLLDYPSKKNRQQQYSSSSGPSSSTNTNGLGVRSGSSGYLSGGSDNSFNNNIASNNNRNTKSSNSTFYAHSSSEKETSRSTPALNNGCSPCPSDDGWFSF